MGECVFYQSKEGDYRCSLTNHSITDAEHVRRYCRGNCEVCPSYRSRQTDDTSSKNSQADDYSALSVILSMICTILLVLWKTIWKFINSLPFWGAYVFALVPILFIDPTNHDEGVVRLFYLAYLVLHTILLFICRKWNTRHQYWPVQVGFILFVVTAVPMWAVSAVAFQIGTLIWMIQNREVM